MQSKALAGVRGGGPGRQKIRSPKIRERSTETAERPEGSPPPELPNNSEDCPAIPPICKYVLCN